MARHELHRTRHALVVACAEYDDPRLQRLSAPLEDASSFAAALADRMLGGFEVTVVQNEASGVVSEQMEAFFQERRRNDLLLLYFSGHGVKDADGRLYFAARNTRPNRLRSTGVPATFVHELMQQSRARSQVLVLDCCHSGAFVRGMVAKSNAQVNLGERLAGRGRVILAASDAIQYAFESGEMVGVGRAASSVFTRCLVEGLRNGAADLDGDGYITADELYDYAHDRITRETGDQSPVMWAFDVHGDLVIARNPVFAPTGLGEAPVVEPPVFLPPTEPTPVLPRRNRRLAAAAAVVVAGLAGFVLWPGGGSNSSGQSPAPLTVKVNFQSPEAHTPDGYLADFGQAYGPRTGSAQGAGLTYGWVREGTNEPLDLIAMGRDRGRSEVEPRSGAEPRSGVEQRLDTFVHMEGWNPALNRIEPAAWEMAVPNGRYAVTLSVGDLTRNSANTVNVEGATAIKDFRGTPTEDYQENTVQATVRDGRLTVDSIGGENTKINYVEVVRLPE